MIKIKKSAAVLLSLILTVSLFASCKGKETRDVISYADTNYNFEQLVKDGTVPELKFKLGANVDELTAFYKQESTSSGSEFEFNTEVKDNISSFSYGTVTYYCNTDKKDAGISGIALFDTAYGFSSGFTTVDDAKEKIKKDYNIITPSDDDGFFIPGGLPEGAKAISIDQNDNNLKIYFVNDKFIAIFLSNGNFSK